jgi:hypothetical protein
MTGRDLVKDIARSANDPNFIITSEVDWLDIINTEGDNLFPDVLIENSTIFTWATSTEINKTNYSIDLSGSTYTNVSEIKDVYLIDSNGKKWPYDNYVYDRISKKIDLDPQDYKDQSIFPSESYPTVEVNWLGRLGNITFATTINLGRAEASLLKKICIKEGLQKILLDHTKLDRYRTLVSRSNEGVLLAIIQSYNMEIDTAKKKLNNINSVKSF